MKDDSTFITNDSSGNLWRLSLDKSKKLVYNIMYSDDKWTKDTKLDVDVLEFNVFKEANDNLHVVYKKHNCIKYCLWDGSQWLGKLIYEFDASTSANELKLITFDGYLHVFFILNVLNSSPPVSYIMHYKSNENKASVKHICTISPNAYCKTQYDVKIINNEHLHLIFTDQVDTNTDINSYMYDNDNWGDLKKLASTDCSVLNFNTIIHFNQLHILLLTSKSNNYKLKDLILSFLDDPVEYILYENDSPLDNIHLIGIDNELHALWSNKNKINYCFFNKEWSFPLKLDQYYSDNLILYNCMSLISNGNFLTCSKIFGTSYPRIRYIYPKEPLSKENIKFIKSKPDVSSSKDSNDELKSYKKSVEDFNQSINYLKTQLQEKQNSCTELKESLSLALKENELLKKELKKHKDNKDEYDMIMSSSNKELNDLKNENTIVNEKLTDLRSENTSLNNKLADLQAENASLNEKLNNVQNENMKSDEEVQRAMIEIKELKETIINLNKEYSDLKNNLKFSKDEYKNLVNSLNFSQSQYNNLLTTLKHTENNYISIQDALNSTKNQFIEVKTKLTLTETLYNELNDKYKFNETKYNDIKNSLDVTKQQLLTVIREKEQLLSHLKVITNEKDALIDQLESESKKSILNKIFK